MNNARLAEVERSLTGIARKVLQAVPVAVECGSRKIQRDMVSHGTHAELRTVEGCLCSLIDAGLVREPTRGCFIRIVAKPKLTVADQEAYLTTAPAAAPVAVLPKPEAATATAPNMESLEKLAAMAQQVRKMADEINALAAQIDDIAVEFEERMQKVTAEGAKFRQLQELLKGMT